VAVKTGPLMSMPENGRATRGLVADEPYGGTQVAFRQGMSAAAGTIKLYGRMRRPRTGRSPSLQLQRSSTGPANPRFRVNEECRASGRVCAWHVKPTIGLLSLDLLSRYQSSAVKLNRPYYRAVSVHRETIAIVGERLKLVGEAMASRLDLHTVLDEVAGVHVEAMMPLRMA
jgi:hypothetical protein